MKKLFAIAACVGLLSVGMANVASAQTADSTAAATTQVDSAAAPAADSAATVAADTVPADQVAGEEAVAETSFHQELKTKFIEGGADFMATIAIALILGLAICLERIIYLNLANVNPDKLLRAIEKALVETRVVLSLRSLIRRSCVLIRVSTSQKSLSSPTVVYRAVSSKRISLGSPSSSLWLLRSGSLVRS